MIEREGDRRERAASQARSVAAAAVFAIGADDPSILPLMGRL